MKVKYYYREIGEGGWYECDKNWYDYASKSPELDTKKVNDN